jgi:lysophospholipase L1-like esterase
VSDQRPQLAAIYDAASRALARVILAHRSHALVVDVACDARSYARPFRASTVHPNDAGYAIVATHVLEALATERGTTVTHCPPYLD